MLALYATLKQSGLGAIPLATSPQPEPSLLTMAPAPGTDPRVEEMMKKVQEVYKHGQASREAAAAGLAVLRSR